MTVFVVVWRDRHVDDTVTVHETIEGANAEIDSIMVQYGDMRWDENKVAGWERAVYCHGDGPSGRIERKEVQP